MPTAKNSLDENSQPKVSVTMPLYNHARYLPATLDSILAQTYRNIEIIVVDDGSTDGSLQIAREYERRHPGKLSVHTHPNNENRGISETVNLSVALATGKYWSGLASDDMFYPHKIERQVALLEKHPEFGFVYGFADYIDDEGNPLEGRMGKDVTDLPDPLEAMLLENHVASVTVMARREAVVRAGGEELGLVFSDWTLWVRLFAMYKAGFIAEPLIKYRVHATNTSVGIAPTVQYKHIRGFYDKVREYCDEGRLDEKYRALIERRIKNLPVREAHDYLDAYFAATLKGQTGKAFSALRGAFRSSPATVLRPRMAASIFKQAISSLIK